MAGIFPIKYIDISGVRFGRLTAEKVVGTYHSQALWQCRCDCGAVKNICAQSLKRGGSRSCGCLSREKKGKGFPANSTHGMRWTSEWSTWRGIKTRCLNSNSKNYKNYGARGITICESWLKFENFYADMGPRPSPLYSIDRIDNNGNYEPSNCRWATSKDQNRNRRGNLVVTAFGKTAALVDFFPQGPNSTEYDRARQRILRHGWDAERAITEPPQIQKKS